MHLYSYIHNVLICHKISVFGFYFLAVVVTEI